MHIYFYWMEMIQTQIAIIIKILNLFMVYITIIYNCSNDFGSKMQMYSICIHINYNWPMLYLCPDQNSHAVKGS